LPYHPYAFFALVQALVLPFFLAREGSAQVVLNEVMADNETVVANDGEYPQWVELRNQSLNPTDISDWSSRTASRLRASLYFLREQ